MTQRFNDFYGPSRVGPPARARGLGIRGFDPAPLPSTPFKKTDHKRTTTAAKRRVSATYRGLLLLLIAKCK